MIQFDAMYATMTKSITILVHVLAKLEISSAFDRFDQIIIIKEAICFHFVAELRNNNVYIIIWVYVLQQPAIMSL